MISRLTDAFYSNKKITDYFCIPVVVVQNMNSMLTLVSDVRKRELLLIKHDDVTFID